MNLGARWNIVDTPEGKAVMYENLEAGIKFDCGVSPVGTPMGMILEFILSEGDPGDLVYLNGKFFTHTMKGTCA